jgi:hypothetical protein
VRKIRNVVPDVGLSSDFICGKQFLSVIYTGLPFSAIIYIYNLDLGSMLTISHVWLN